MGPEDWIQCRTAGAHRPSDSAMNKIMRCTFQLLPETEKVGISHDGIELSSAYSRKSRHISLVPCQKQRTGRIQKGGINSRVLVPIPVRQPKLGFACQLLANSFEVQKIRPMPIKEMIGAMLAELKQQPTP